MKHRFKRLKWLLLAVVIAAGSIYAAWELTKPAGPPPVKWKGALTVWTSEGEDITTLLNVCSTAFTNRNKNTLIIIKNMERSTMELYLSGSAPAETQMPDIVIFSSGMISNPSEMLMPLTTPETLIPSVSGAAVVNGSAYALPFLLDVPVLIGQDIPADHGGLKEMLEADPPKKPTYQVFEGNQAALLMAVAGADASGLNAKLNSANADDGYALSRAIANGTKLFVGSYRQARRGLTRGLKASAIPRSAQGMALVSRTVSAGVVKQDEPEQERLEAAAAFVSYLIEEQAQLGVIASGYFSSTGTVAGRKEDEGGITSAQALYDSLTLELGSAFVPSVFESADRQNRRRDVAAAILMGDVSRASEWSALCGGK